METKLPQTFTLTKEERLESQNMELKMQILNMQTQAVMSEQNSLLEIIAKRVGIQIDDIRKYVVNPKTGEAALTEPPK